MHGQLREIYDAIFMCSDIDVIKRLLLMVDISSVYTSIIHWINPMFMSYIISISDRIQLSDDQLNKVIRKLITKRREIGEFQCYTCGCYVVVTLVKNVTTSDCCGCNSLVGAYSDITDALLYYCSRLEDNYDITTVDYYYHALWCVNENVSAASYDVDATPPRYDKVLQTMFSHASIIQRFTSPDTDKSRPIWLSQLFEKNAYHNAVLLSHMYNRLTIYVLFTYINARGCRHINMKLVNRLLSTITPSHVNEFQSNEEHFDIFISMVGRINLQCLSTILTKFVKFGLPLHEHKALRTKLVHRYLNDNYHDGDQIPDNLMTIIHMCM